MRLVLSGMVCAIALASPVHAQDDAAAQCAGAARYPTPDDPTGKEWDQLDAEAAVALCAAAVAGDPANAAARANLGRALIKAARDDEGLAELRRAAEAGDPQAQRQLGIQLAEGEDEAVRREGFGWIERAANGGYAPAFVTLSDYLWNGVGTTVDEAAAVGWARRGQDARDPGAINQLGLYHEKGVGVAKDAAEAARFYRLAAEMGEPIAMRNLAISLENGDGMERDYAEALAWHRRAVEAGNAESYADIGSAYAEGQGVARDDAEAVRWYRKGHEAGDANATSLLALMTENGRGVPRKDLAEALVLYREAAEGGDAWAMLNMGEQYYYGLGVTPDYATAMEWYRRAAEAGDEGSYYRVGYAHQLGQGVARDITEAIVWYERGRAAGCAECVRQLGSLYENGLGVEQDLARAATLYREAAEAGNAAAMRNVARMYRFGKGAPRDHEVARQWDRRAAEAGGGNAMIDLGRSLLFGTDGFEIDIPEARVWLAEALSLGAEEAGSLLVLATLTDETLAERERAAAALLVEHGRREAGWALASLAYPGVRLAGLAEMPDPQEWRAKLAGPLPPDALFSASEAFRNGLIAHQDLRLAVELTGRAASSDQLNARGRELDLLISMKLFSAALTRYEAFVSSAEYLELPADQRATFERKFAQKVDDCAVNAMGSVDVMVELANRGQASAAFALGKYYYSADNPEQDLAEARYWYQRAVELGSTSALISLGYMNSFGEGGPQDQAAAFGYYLRAAEAGDVVARHNVAVMYDEGKGVPEDHEKAALWLTRAAEGGKLESYVRLAGLRFAGRGTPVDPAGAIADLRRAIDCLDISGIYYMAKAHFEGSGVPRDTAAGLRWMHFAAGFDRDYIGAEGLARAYAGAWGVAPDAGQAFEWLEEARSRGSEWAAKALEACASDPSAGCLARVEDFEPDKLMERPKVAVAALPGLAEDEQRLLAARDAALAAGNDLAAAEAFGSLDILYRIYREPERLLANNAVRIIASERQMERVHGSRDNYFALFTTSCAWSRASDAAKAIGHDEAAVLFAKVAVNRLQQARRYIADLDDDVRECFIAAHRDRYRELAARFLDLGRFSEAENVLGMLKDFEFQGYTGEAGDRGLSYAAMPLTSSQEGVLALYDRADRLFTGDRRDPAFAAALSELTGGLLALENAPQTIAGGAQDPEPDVRATLRQAGRADVVTVQAVVQPERIYWLVTGAAGQKLVRVPIEIAELTRMVREYHAALGRADEDLPELAERLFRKTFAPVDAELRAMGAREVLLSLDETLRYLPFAALHDGTGWLVERYAFGQFRKPEELLRGGHAGERPTIAGFGVTKAAEGFAALPMVAQEVAAIVREDLTDDGILSGTASLDEKFDRTAFAQAAAHGFDAIHVASHFDLDPHNRKGSFLLIGGGQKLPLSAFGQEQGIRFGAAEFLALSACNTAIGQRDASGVEIDSLAEIVRKAGAKTILASLWQVADSSTPLLMTEFYRGRFVAEQSNAEALRQAQLMLIERGRAGEGPVVPGAPSAEVATFDNPFFWAPFVVTGNLPQAADGPAMGG